jgi:hypothetical protein
MTTSRLTTIGLAAIAAILFAAPASANNVGQHGNASQSSISEAPSTGCSSYMKAPDGSWTKIPCEEAGARAAAAKRSGTRTTEKSD